MAQVDKIIAAGLGDKPTIQKAGETAAVAYNSTPNSTFNEYYVPKAEPGQSVFTMGGGDGAVVG
ncbi:MAG: hypothetical protein LBJ74_02730 [Heliobacteriaceae bacterium]|nr:hypothetical protein [Heliobacteriaceae bacterium]